MIDGRTIIGAGQGAGLTYREMGASGGKETHVLTINEMPNHSHGIYSGYYGGSDNSIASDAHSRGDHTVYHNTLAVGGSQPHNNMQPYVALLACIKY